MKKIGIAMLSMFVMVACMFSFAACNNNDPLVGKWMPSAVTLTIDDEEITLTKKQWADGEYTESTGMTPFACQEVVIKSNKTGTAKINTDGKLQTFNLTWAKAGKIINIVLSMTFETSGEVETIDQPFTAELKNGKLVIDFGFSATPVHITFKRVSL